jgi:hypothetical protein
MTSMPEWLRRARPRTPITLVCAAILVGAASHAGHSVESMDVRTYAQMIRGVAEHGLPYWDNGPIERFPALVVPWGVPAHGKIWGIYGPLYAYAAAPLFKLASLGLVSRATFALMCPLAIVTYLLAARVVKNRWYASLAGVLAVVSTPVTAKALEITAYPLATLLATVGVYYAVRAAEGPARGAAFWCGLAWGAAGATHALCFPMAMVSLAVAALAPDPATGRSGLRVATGRLGPALLGVAAVMAPSAWLNHVRFGSWNPVSYGPIPWTGVVNPELLKQNVGDQLRYGAPCVALVGALLVAVFFARRRRAVVLALFGGAVLVAVLVDPLRARFLRFAFAALGNLVDVTAVDMGAPYLKAPDGVGRIFGGWAVKSLLQCTPLLALAPLAVKRAPAGKRWAVLALLGPTTALVLALVLRANLSYVDAIGWPWVYIRYLMPAFPALVVASIVVVEHLAWGPRDALVAAGLGTLLAAGFIWSAGDATLMKRVLVLVAPLAGAGFAVVAAVRSDSLQPRAARLGVTLTIAMGIGAGIGHDLRANVDVKSACDRYVDHVDRTVPRRFALIGWLGQFDVALSTTATHDVEYADLMRLSHWEDVRPLLDHWRAADRPIFLVAAAPIPSAWPDVTIDPIAGGPSNLYAVRFHEARSVQGGAR